MPSFIDRPDPGGTSLRIFSRAGFAGIVLSFLALLASVAAAAGPDEDRIRKLMRLSPTEELPWKQLEMPPDREPETVTSREAAEDVERLFHLLEHGWSGWAFFDENDRFASAKARILEDLPARDERAPDEFAALLRRHLSFVRDCHTRIGGVAYGEHRDFWHDTTLALRPDGDGFRFEKDGATWVAVRIAGEDPAKRVKPGLDANGEAVHRIGVLSASDPGPLTLEARGPGGPRSFRVELKRSDFRFYSRRLFREDRVGGIPVLRIRTFSDHHGEDLERFLDAADRLREEPCVIVDLRGNGGGNEAWITAWVRRLAGAAPGCPFLHSEMISRTTRAGRANYMARLASLYPDVEFYRREAERFAGQARSLEAPYWTGLRRPDNPVIRSDITLVIVTNGLVGSAGEGFVLRAGQLQNVVVVGENTRGALTFGNVSAHRLPHSGLFVQLPVNFGLFPDLVFREEVGLSPDFWVPAADAVNCAVAAVRRGTIPTVRPLSPLPEFVPEDTRHLRSERRRRTFVVGAFALLSGTGVALLARRFIRYRRRARA